MKESQGEMPADHQRDLESGALLASVLSSPVRLGVVDLLSRNGPMRSTEIAALLDISETQLGNHLKRMRDAQVVHVDRRGKAAVYRISSDEVSDIAAALLREPPKRDLLTADRTSALRYARSCYDHLAGELGVRLCSWMLARDVLDLKDDGGVSLGAGAEPVLIAIGVGLTGLNKSNRRLAFLCPDWTQNSYHLGGALGAAVLDSMLQKRWLEGARDSRELHVTQQGSAFFEALT